MNCARLMPGSLLAPPVQTSGRESAAHWLRRFPYAVYFAVEGALIVVLAVLHAVAIRRSGSDAVAN